MDHNVFRDIPVLIVFAYSEITTITKPTQIIK